MQKSYSKTLKNQYIHQLKISRFSVNTALQTSLRVNYCAYRIAYSRTRQIALRFRFQQGHFLGNKRQEEKKAKKGTTGTRVFGRANNMDRTEDLLKIVQIYQPDAAERARSSAASAPALSLYQEVALRVSSSLKHTDLLIRRLEELAGHKGFSNDPTAAIAEISDLFQKRVSSVKSDMDNLKRLLENGGAHAEHGGPHQSQHYKLIFQVLNKRMLKHIESFQGAIKQQDTHAEQRAKRLAEYGQASSSQFVPRSIGADLAGGAGAGSGGGGGGGAGVSGQYAMFARNSAPPPPPPSFIPPPAQVPIPTNVLNHQSEGPASQASQELRRRTTTASSAQYQQHQQHQTQQGGPIRPQRGPYTGQGMAWSTGSTAVGTSSGASAYSNAQQSEGGWGGANGHNIQTQAQSQNRARASRLKFAEKAEQKVAQMGALFQQMASLVMEQSETIARIEDDVESGLTDTKEGHKHLTEYYERSKGNRGMIIKVFFLLAFFILLFMWWT